MLEPDEAKVSSPVLRGPAPSNGGWPLGTIGREITPREAQTLASCTTSRLSYGPNGNCLIGQDARFPITKCRIREITANTSNR